MTRAAVAFPGRGAYTPSALGALTAGHPWVRRADELRADMGLDPLAEIDGAPRFDPDRHLRPIHAWPLTFLCSLLDAERIADDHEVVVVVASSTGWYTALAAAGALGFDDAFRLVQEMARAADEPLPDDAVPSELVYPLADDSWRPIPERREALAAALSSSNGGAAQAVDLAAFAMVGGSSAALERLAGALPAVQVGPRTYPLRLPRGDAWHTPLRASAAETAGERLADLAWEAPNVTLIDGRGRRFTPWSTDPRELADYTLHELPVTAFDFATAFRAALREYAPDVVLLPGPGTSLGAACAHVIVDDGYRGARSRGDFESIQAGPSPILLSMRR